MPKNRRNQRRYHGQGQNQYQHRRNGTDMRPYAYDGHQPNNSHWHGHYHPQAMNEYHNDQSRRGPQPAGPGYPLYHQPHRYPGQQFPAQGQQFPRQGQLLQQPFIPRPRPRLSGVDSIGPCSPLNDRQLADQPIYSVFTDPYFLNDLDPPGVDEHWHEESMRWLETSGRYQRPETNTDAGTGWMGDIEQLVADSGEVETRLIDALRDFDSSSGQAVSQAEIDGWIPEHSEDELV